MQLNKVYLANESGDEQQHQDAVVVAAVSKEGLRHEGGEEGNVSVGLTHLHLPQLHLNGLETAQNTRVTGVTAAVAMPLLLCPTLA